MKSLPLSLLINYYLCIICAWLSDLPILLIAVAVIGWLVPWEIINTLAFFISFGLYGIIVFEIAFVSVSYICGNIFLTMLINRDYLNNPADPKEQQERTQRMQLRASKWLKRVRRNMIILSIFVIMFIIWALLISIGDMLREVISFISITFHKPPQNP